jgi:polysaccharide biosynthesis transport protein
MPIQSYLSVVGRRWKLLLAFILIPTFIAVVMVQWVVTPVYQGKTSVIFPLKKASTFMRRSLNDMDIPVGGMSSLLDTSATLYNHIAIIESRTLALRVSKYLKTEKNIDLLSTYKKIAEDPDLNDDEKDLALAAKMQKRVHVEDADRGIAEITFLHSDPNIAAATANAYVNQTLSFLNELNQATQSDLADFLEARQKEVDTALIDVEGKIEKAKEETGILAVEEQATQLIKSYADIQALVTQAEIDYQGSVTTAKNMEKAGMDMQEYYKFIAAGTEEKAGPAKDTGKKEPSPAIDALADATIARLRSQLDDLELKRQQAMLYSTPENPDVIALNSQIDATRREMYREFSNYYDASVSELVVESTAYQAQLKVGKDIMGQLDKRLTDFPPEERRLIMLQRDRDVQESIYLVVTQELEQARIQQKREESPFTILDEALVPNKPMKPRKLLITFGTLAISFWFGILIIFMQDSRSRAAVKE